jgi:hypothetical protein
MNGEVRAIVFAFIGLIIIALLMLAYVYIPP